jgi:hypothetical protein
LPPQPSAQPSARARGTTSPRAAYTNINDSSNNEIVVFHRAVSRIHVLCHSVATGSRGSGTAEDSSNGLVLAGPWLDVHRQTGRDTRDGCLDAG